VLVTEPGEIRQRLGAVEQRVAVLEEEQAGSRRAAELFAAVDRDVADVKEAFTAQRHVLQALRDTQLEQGRALVEQGRAIGGIVVTLQTIQETLADHGRTLADHGRTLADHGRTLADHGRMLRDHGRMLRDHGRTLAQHGGVLARLDPGEDPG
jgi:hypothetical protein